LLTETQIQQRCKTENIAVVDKINLWGLELEDISILGRMPGLEVVSLSMNKISSLEIFACLP